MNQIIIAILTSIALSSTAMAQSNANDSDASLPGKALIAIFGTEQILIKSVSYCEDHGDVSPDSVKRAIDSWYTRNKLYLDLGPILLEEARQSLFRAKEYQKWAKFSTFTMPKLIDLLAGSLIKELKDKGPSQRHEACTALFAGIEVGAFDYDQGDKDVVVFLNDRLSALRD